MIVSCDISILEISFVAKKKFRDIEKKTHIIRKLWMRPTSSLFKNFNKTFLWLHRAIQAIWCNKIFSQKPNRSKIFFNKKLIAFSTLMHWIYTWVVWVTQGHKRAKNVWKWSEEAERDPDRECHMFEAENDELYYISIVVLLLKRSTSGTLSSPFRFMKIQFFFRDRFKFLYSLWKYFLFGVFCIFNCI